MKLPFTKMHGLGNDFVVLNFTENQVELSAEHATFIADRNFGVGCDQILIVEHSDKCGIDFKYRIINADGNEVGQCGNGSRCLVRYIHEKGLSSKNPIKVETSTGELILKAHQGSNLVTVDMGAPRFEPTDIPLDKTTRKILYSLEVNGETVEFSASSMGNPHAVLLVNDTLTAPVERLGPLLENHPVFPEKTNVGFMQVISRTEINVRVFERGAGETIACGSGTCAAVVAGIQRGLLDSRVTAHLHGGDLIIEWQGDGQAVMMTGPAETTFEGVLKLEPY